MLRPDPAARGRLTEIIRNLAGLCPLEAGVALFIDHGTFPRRDDFTSRFIER